MIFNGVMIRLGEYMVRRTSARKIMSSRLVESIKMVLERRGIKGFVKYVEERILVFGLEEPVFTAKILSKVFGVSSTSPVYIVEGGIDVLEKVVVEFTSKRLDSSETFMVRVFNAPYPLSNRGIEKYLGGVILNKVGSGINLKSPDKVVYVEFRGPYIIVTDTLFQGIGGLPYGSEGCLSALISGGVDSAVASIYAMRRGVSIIPVFNNLSPYWSSEAVKRAMESIELLWEWTPWNYMKAYIVHGVGNIIASQSVPSRIRCILCKAIMYNIASIISERENCFGILTGEAVGQVASQTLNNMNALTTLSPKPVYRPLAFMDKIDIISIARSFGLDRLNRKVGVCKLRPQHPTIKISKEEYNTLRRVLDNIHDSLEELVDNADIIEFS